MSKKFVSREIDEDAHINDPNLAKDRARLTALAQKHLRQTQEEIDDSDFTDTEDDDGEFTQLPPNPHRDAPNRGSLAAQERRKRIEATEKRLKEKGLDAESLTGVRQTFNPDIPDNEIDEVMEEQAKPEQPISREERIQRALGKRKPISNKEEMPVRAARANPGDMSALEKQIADQGKIIKEMQVALGQLPKPPSKLAERRKKYEAEYTKVELSSQAKFYTFTSDDIRFKKIDIPTQIAITTARRLNDVSGYIDAVGATLQEGVDIRDLTNNDWFNVLYYQKFTSYPRTSLVLTWTSKYGNENKYKVQQSDLKTINPSISKEDFDEKYRSKGLVYPTLRDWELLNTSNGFTNEDRDIYSRAQYFAGNTVEEKVDNMFSKGSDLEVLELIAEMIVECHHGVVDTVEVRDEKFDPADYLEKCQSHIKNLEDERDRYSDNPAIGAAITQEISSMEEEINTIQVALEEGSPVLAEVETQPVRFNVLDIFPSL